MSGPELAVRLPVVREIVGLAAMEVPGVLRVGWAGPRLRRLITWRPVAVRVRDGVVTTRIVIVARPGQDLGDLAADVRAAAASAIERLLGLEVGEVTVRIDGVGG
jgi:uncharacterized alkaline shock family protein YloU